MKKLILVGLLLNLIHLTAATTSTQAPADPIAKAMKAAIKKKQIPGGVVLITHRGMPIYHKAFGMLAVEPHKRKAKIDSMYDLASLSKLYTATLIMRLHDQGLIDVGDPVSKYLAAFCRPDKAKITIEQLLNHYAGLAPATKLRDYSLNTATTITNIATTNLRTLPGTKFIYSDLGPIIAGYLAEKMAHKPLHTLLKEYVFMPLGLHQTQVLPSPRFAEHIAPNNQPNGKLVGGRVFDPRAYAMGGLAGNAGVFAMAADVAKFAQVFLNDGMVGDFQFLSSQSVKRMTMPRWDMPDAGKRGIGFDIDTPYSSPRGTFFSKSSFGHTGSTGTSVWIDPGTKTVVVLLCNSLHPTGKGNINKLRAEISTIAAKMAAAIPTLKTP